MGRYENWHRGELRPHLRGALLVLHSLRRAVGRSRSPLLAWVTSAALVAGCALSLAPERPIQAPGTGMAGTAAEPGALWSGPVTCEWFKGESWIDRVEGFEVPVADVEFVPGRPSLTGTVFRVSVANSQGWMELGPNSSQNFDVRLDLADQARSGTAVPVTGEPVLSWTCSHGP